jgi:hypothetical protein
MFPFSTPGNLPTGTTSSSLILFESFSFISTASARTSGRTSVPAVRFGSVSNVHTRARAAWTSPCLRLCFMRPHGVPCRPNGTYTACPRGACRAPLTSHVHPMCNTQSTFFLRNRRGERIPRLIHIIRSTFEISGCNNCNIQKRRIKHLKYV